MQAAPVEDVLHCQPEITGLVMAARAKETQCWAPVGVACALRIGGVCQRVEKVERSLGGGADTEPRLSIFSPVFLLVTVSYYRGGRRFIHVNIEDHEVVAAALGVVTPMGIVPLPAGLVDGEREKLPGGRRPARFQMRKCGIDFLQRRCKRSVNAVLAAECGGHDNKRTIVKDKQQKVNEDDVINKGLLRGCELR
jgi:hypothetical protein